MSEGIFKLTDSQQDSINKLTAWWESDSEHIILSGAPGTGKTFLAKYFVENLPKAVPLFTAPTNEAVRQLELSLGSTNATVKTTYSALGLSLSTRSFKQFIYQRQLPEDFYDYNLLIIDEASMAGRQEEKEANKLRLIDYVVDSGMRCIWLGDWAQLPPVDGNGGESPVFTAGWETLELTQVKRHSGVILDFAYSLRDILGKPVRNMPAIPEGIQKVAKKNSMNFGADSFDAIVADEARILVWTNKSTRYCPRPGVEEYNHNIRSRLFGEELAVASTVYPSDKILFASPLFSCDKPLELSESSLLETEFSIKASVNTRAEVLKTEPAKILGIKVWRTEVELEGGINTVCYIPTVEGQIVKAKMEASMREQAAEATDRKEAGDIWHFYHTFRGVFAEIKHTYCITGHRAQGSTVKKVFVDTANILQNRDRLVAFKNLYVCCTRAQEELVLFV